MVPQVACRNVPHLRRARLHATGRVRPCASDGNPDLPWRLGNRRPQGGQREATHDPVAQTISTRVGRAGPLYLEAGISAARRTTYSPMDGSPSCPRPIRPEVPGLAVTGMGGHRRPPRPRGTRTTLARRHGYRHPERIARMRPQTLGDLLHQTLITESTGEQGIPAHGPRGLAAAGPRTRSLLGGPWVATSNRRRGDRPGRVPDGPKDHPSLVSLTSHLRRLHASLPHRGRSANGARRSSTSSQSDRQSTPPQGP